MDRVKSLFGSRNYEAQEDEGNINSNSASSAATPNGTDAERGFIAEALDASTMSWSTRIQGFLACFVIGVFIAVLAAVMFSITFNLATFGILYTLGNLVALASTLFLMGPTNQIKRMFSKERWMASTAMLLFLVLTLISAFVLQKKALTILMVVLQFLAMTWYCLSYIPFARDAVIKFFDKLIS